jgi:hypothetical protein
MEDQDRETLRLAYMLLSRAADLIRAYRAHAHGAYARDARGRAVIPTARAAMCWDIVGALVRVTDVATEHAAPENRPRWRRAARAALRALARAAEPEAANGSLGLVATALARYNDRYGHDAALQLIDQAHDAIYARLYAQ